MTDQEDFHNWTHIDLPYLMMVTGHSRERKFELNAYLKENNVKFCIEHTTSFQHYRMYVKDPKIMTYIRLKFGDLCDAV